MGTMSSGSLSAFVSASPPELFGEPPGPDDKCEHGWPEGDECPYCAIEGLEDDLRLEQDNADYWFDRFQEMCVIVGAVAEDWA